MLCQTSCYLVKDDTYSRHVAHSQRRDTLQSANILRNKFTSLNLENTIVIYIIMTIKVEHMLCQMVNYKSIITCRHGGFLWVKMEHLFVRVFGGSPTF